ncbi:MAG: serine hydrolase [Pseudomonadota bacterium]
MLLINCSNANSNDGIEPEGQPTIELKTPEKIPQLMDDFGVSGLAVTAVSGDEVLLAQGYGTTQDGEAFTSSTRCGLFSATKVLASLTYAKLENTGLLRLDEPLGSYLPDAPEEWRSIPLYRLLNHSSGITMVVNKQGFEALGSDPDATNKSVYEIIRKEPLEHEPGAYSRYRQSGYAVGEVILEEKLNKDFSALVSKHISEPAGLTSTSHPTVTDERQPAILLSAGGYETTVDDLSQLLKGINSGAIISPTVWKDLLLQDRYRFGDYSLGSVIEERGDVLTVGHSGGGARANIRYAPDEGVGVMICTDDQSNNSLAISLARMLIHEMTTGEMPGMPLWSALAGYSEMTGGQVIAAFKRAKSEGAKYDFSDAEAVFNQIGYAFLSQGQAANAIEVLAFNVESFPDSPNAHDSLGEAFLTAGDMDAALARYRHVLTLDPGNANATKMIAGIERRLNETKDAEEI